jgi:hypothetical protein
MTEGEKYHRLSAEVWDRVLPKVKALAEDIVQECYLRYAQSSSKEIHSFCRQIFHQAKAHISEHGRRYTAPSQEAQERLVERFLAATQQGEVQALAAALAEDVSWWADGGGKVYAAPYALHGRERVLSLLGGLLRKAPSWYPDLHFSSALINGTPGIVTWSKETLVAIITCEMTEEHITNLYEVINPDKLTYIQRQMQPHQ